MQSLRFVCAGALVASLASAQLTLTSGNLGFTTGALSATSQTPRSLDLLGDPLQVDHGFEHWWYFRIAGDTAETSLRDIGGVVSNTSANGEHGDHDFLDVDGRGLLKASLDFDAHSAGPASGAVFSRLTVMNISGAPLTVDLFAYTDLDIAASAGNDTVTGDGQRHFVTDASGVQIEVRGIGATASDVLGYPAIRQALTDTDVDDLGNSLPPFTGDYTGAFQWTATLAPFEQRTFMVVLAIDAPVVAPPMVEHFGAGNTSTFEAFADELPLQDLTQPRSFGVKMRGAPANAEYRIITGLTPWTPLPFIAGIDLWVDPASIIAVFGGFADANGQAANTWTVPNNAYLTGISIYHQCFAVDAGAPNGYAVFSPGLHTKIGKL